MATTRQDFVNMVKKIRDLPHKEILSNGEDLDGMSKDDVLEVLSDDLGYVEILAKLVPLDILETFAWIDGPIFADGNINWPPPKGD